MTSRGRVQISTPTLGSYAEKKARLIESWQQGEGPLRLEKSTISNLFRYESRAAPARRISLREFNGIIGLDSEAATLEVEGLATFETIVSHTLERGFLPLVAPELKHITIGGATVGIGIESTCFRYGFVHDALLEADVLLPGGRIVTCTPDNEHADLFRALPNSYGTLGYILRAKIALHRAKPFTQLQIECFDNSRAYLDAMRAATEDETADFVEGLYFEDRRFFLKTGRMVGHIDNPKDIVRDHIYYKLVEREKSIGLRTFDYIFRYDPEWFWNLPETAFYSLFRRFAPLRFRNSGFYTRYVAWKEKLVERLGLGSEKTTEPLIQDWEVPWEAAEELIEFSLNEVDLGGRPWAAVPIRTPATPTLYPIEANKLYFNLGCYLQVDKPAGREDYYYTRILDDKCFELGGIKMLYSSTFLDRDSFDRIFNGAAYAPLKARYDEGNDAQWLYDKVAMKSR